MARIRKSHEIDKTSQNGRKVASSQKKSRPTTITDSVLRVRIDDQRRAVGTEDAHDSDKLKRLDDELRGARIVKIENLSALLQIPPGPRIWLLKVFANLPDGVRLLDGVDARADIFDSIVKMDAEISEMKVADSWRSAALEAAVVKFPRSLELACEQIRRRLKQLGHGVPRLEILVKDARAILTRLNLACRGSEQLPTVQQSFPDLNINDELRIPSGWLVSLAGIKRVDDEQIVSQTPIILAAKCRHLHDHSVSVELAWTVDGRWHREIVPRIDIADARKLVQLARYDFPVTSNNAATLVQYLADFEAENAAVLPTIYATEQMGWYTVNGQEVFICGGCVIRSELKANCEEHSQDVSRAAEIRFIPPDLGNQQICDSLKPKGTFSEWKTAIDHLQGFPRVLLALHASLAAPLLRNLRVASFIVDFAGETSIGKTSSLRVAASAWGNPWESGPDAQSFVFSWDATPTFLERLAATVQNIPVIVDETKRASWATDTLPKSVYAFCSGRGRGRGSIEGMRSSATWATVAISSGEQPLTSFTKDGGTQARVIQLWGPPFGKADAPTAQLVRGVIDDLRRNYGHAGPRFVEWLIQHRGEWDQFRKRYFEIRSTLIANSGNKPLAIRLCEFLAAICLAEDLAASALGLPSGKMVPLSVELLKQASETDRAADALRWALDWARKNQDRFFDIAAQLGGADQSKFRHEYVGRWDTGNREWIGIIPAELEKVLKGGGYDADSVVRTWKDRGWLHLQKGADGKQRTRIQTRIGREGKARVIAIRYEAIAQVDPSPAIPPANMVNGRMSRPS